MAPGLSARSTPTNDQEVGGRVRSAAGAYALSILALVAAVLLRYALEPWMAGELPLVTLFGAVAAAVWVGGYRPAILVTILGYFACSYLFVEPRGTFALANLGQLIGLIAYFVTCALIIGFGQAARMAHLRASGQRELL